MNATFELNTIHNGIEVTFPERPSYEVREKMKSAGFKWHHMKKCWYGKQTKERLSLARLLALPKEDLCGDGTPLADVGKEIAEQAKQKAKKSHKKSETTAAVAPVEETTPIVEASTTAAVEESSEEKYYAPERVTSKTIEAARKRLLKLAMGTPSKAMHGLTPTDDNKFWLIHSHFLMRLDSTIPGATIVPEADRFEKSFTNKFFDYFKKDLVQVDRPNTNELKDFIATNKEKFRCGECHVPYFLKGDALEEQGFDVAVNPKYLLDMLQALPYGKLYVSADSPHEIYVISLDENGMILPIRAPKPNKQ